MKDLEVEEPQVAERRARVNGLVKLLPLGVLVVCVIAATIAGVVFRDNGGPAPDPVPVAAKAKACPATSVPKLPAREPWRNKALRKASEKAFKKGIVKEHPAYIKGKGGWLFWNDWQINDFSQSLGRVNLSAKQAKAWAKYFKKLESAAESQGGKFQILIMPAKWEIYPKKMPKWTNDLVGSHSLDILMRAYPNLPWWDVRKALRSAAKTNATYEPLDSHWTPYGGYVAWKAVAGCLRKSAGFEGATVPPITGVGKVKSSNEFADNGIVPNGDQRTVPLFANAHIPVKYTNITTGADVVKTDHVVDMLETPLRTDSTGAQTAKSLLVLRDSTGNALAPVWSETFQTTYQYEHPVLCPIRKDCATVPSYNPAALVTKHNPDLTVFLMSERYLGYGPPK